MSSVRHSAQNPPSDSWVTSNTNSAIPTSSHDKTLAACEWPWKFDSVHPLAASAGKAPKPKSVRRRGVTHEVITSRRLITSDCYNSSGFLAYLCARIALAEEQ